ncbi:MAG: phosphate ABC transporter permease subunit PstC [Bacilli bacterium]
MDVGYNTPSMDERTVVRRKKTLKKNILKSKLFRLTALLSLGLMSFFLIALVYFVGSTGIKVFEEVSFADYFFSLKWDAMNNEYGIGLFIIGSIATTFLTLLFCVPISLMVAITLVKWVPQKFQGSLRSMLDILVGVPSVVYGYIGLTMLVPLVRDSFQTLLGEGIFVASIVLTIMVLPTITRICEDAISAVDTRIEEGSVALGATSVQTIFRTTLPAARSGILTAVILGMTRALGETMAVVMVIGNMPQLFTSGTVEELSSNPLIAGVQQILMTITTPTATLTSNIVMEVMNVAYDSTQNYALYMMAVILLLLSLFFIVLIRMMRGRQ